MRRESDQHGVAAETMRLREFATNDNSPRALGSEAVLMLVAGAGFEPATFRL